MILSNREILGRIDRGDLKIFSSSDGDVLESKAIAMDSSSIFLQMDDEIILLDEERPPSAQIEKFDRRLQPEELTFLDEGSRIKIDKIHILRPGCRCLVYTKERLELRSQLAGRIDVISSLVRRGLFATFIPGSLHPGFSGRILIELCNRSHLPLALRPELTICQLYLEYIVGLVDEKLLRRQQQSQTSP